MANWHLYCDESSKDHPYLVFGGILVRADIAPGLAAELDEWRTSCGMIGEISWKKTTADRLERYKQFAALAIDNARMGRISFRCAVFDRDDDGLFKGTPRDEAYAKRLHQYLLHSFGLRLPEVDQLFIFPDHEFLPCPPEELRTFLNSGIGMRRCAFDCNVVRFIKPHESKKSRFIQMADLLSGAVAAGNNFSADANSKRGAAKRELSAFIAARAGVDFTRSNFGRMDFRIWHFVPLIKLAAMQHAPIKRAP